MRKPLITRVAKWRFWMVSTLLILVALGLLARMLDLTVFDQKFLRGQGDARTLRVVSMPAYRGMITDRNGEPLAISTPVDAIWVNAKQFHPTLAQIQQIAKLLNLSPSDLKQRLQKNSKKEFLYLKRQIDPAVSAQVKALNLEGLYLKREFRRYYPEGEVAAQFIGITNIDDRGQAGMELAYDQWLQGRPGKKRVIKDRLGNTVADIDVIREPVPGHNLVLSIDQRIQYIAYSALKEAVIKNKAPSGSIVVLDARTGEVLAMANVPSFNPNNRSDFDPDNYRNRALTDTFEPGSTLKTFMAANAFASGKYTPDSLIDTSPGYMYLNGWKVDDEGHNNGLINMTRIIQLSSNMGATRVTLSLPPQSLPTLLKFVGFGQRTTTDFPGESAGNLPRRPVWSPISLATLSFGYGISVTITQLAGAYQIFAADGIKYPISLLRLDAPAKGRLILAPHVAQQIRQVLQAVLEGDGTGTSARIPGYQVAGKTGTARILGPKGYQANHHNALFVGMAPASNPRLVVAVFIHDPQGRSYYGGPVAGPAFAKVMGGALRTLNVPPDRIENPTSVVKPSVKPLVKPTVKTVVNTTTMALNLGDQL